MKKKTGFKKTGYGLAVFVFWAIMAFGLNLDAQTAIDPMASAVARSIGYALGGQDDAARSISQVEFASVQDQLTSRINKGFYLSGVAISHYNTKGNKGSLKGMLIHQDRYKRELFYNFSADFNGLDKADLTRVAIEPIKSLKPMIRLYIVSAEKVSMQDLKNATFTRALEQVSTAARKLDGSVPGDSQPVDYLAVAFVMNQLAGDRQVKLFMDTEPGSFSGRKTGQVIDKDGWQLAVISEHFSCDQGPEYFFNIVTGSLENPQIAGVYSTHSLGRRVQQALTLRGYHPGPVDGRPGKKTAQAVKAFQKDAGLDPDGRLSASLLRLLMSPGLDPAGMVVQRNLAQLGYDIGTIDGVIGPRSVAAIQDFQDQRKLRPQTVMNADLVCTTSDALAVFALSSLKQDHLPKTDPEPVTPEVNRFENRMWPNRADK